MGERVLVTGAGGFLGQYVVEKLIARGDHVRAIGRGDYPALKKLGVETRKVDLRDRKSVVDACEGMDVVQHIAAIAGIFGAWKEFYEINFVGTENIVHGCQKHGIGRLVYTSSPSVTFAGTDQLGIDETAPYPDKWLCYYPQTKAMAEQLVLKSNAQGKLTTCALRPHLIWGPRDQHLIPRLLDRARQKKLRIVGDGKSLVDMIYVENAADAQLLASDAMQRNPSIGGSAYFLSQGEPVNCWEWINDILKLAKIPPVEKKISLRTAWIAGSILESAYKLLGRTDEPRMTRFLAAQLATSHYFSIEKAKRELGYAPAISTAEGMKRLGEWINRGGQSL